MSRVTIAITTISLAAASLLAGASSASAETITAASCAEIDYQVTVGTTVVFPHGADCPYAGYAFDAVFDASTRPSVVFDPATGAPLLWHQSYARAAASDPCDAGWEPSWAEWANAGTGGFTCDRTINWGVGAGGVPTLSVTVLLPTDGVRDIAWEQYVMGCGVDSQGDDYAIVTNCS